LTAAFFASKSFQQVFDTAMLFFLPLNCTRSLSTLSRKNIPLNLSGKSVI